MGQFTDPNKAAELLRPGHTFAEVSPSGAALILAEYERRGADAESYRELADKVIEWFNPRDDDVAEVAIVSDAVMRAGKFIEAQPCTCEEGAAEFDVDPCARCAALGCRADQPVEW